MVLSFSIYNRSDVSLTSHRHLFYQNGGESYNLGIYDTFFRPSNISMSENQQILHEMRKHVLNDVDKIYNGNKAKI